MKVMAINSSPKMGKGNTAMIMNPFLDGMKEADTKIEIDLFYTRKLNISPCIGCCICNAEDVGKCFQKDDMEMLIPKLKEADVLVLGVPVYWSGPPGPMKNLIDRMGPLLKNSVEIFEGRYRTMLRHRVKNGKLVLVSTCFDWELDNVDFKILCAQIGEISKYLRREFIAPLLRPHADMMAVMIKEGISLDDIFDAAREAGHQLVRDGKISLKTTKMIGRELLPQKAYIERITG